MFGDHPKNEAIRFVKAFLTNQYARFAPRSYVQFTRQTGRGEEEGNPCDVASYFSSCFYEYFQRLGISEEEISSFLSRRRLLEYGPGDIPGVALLMVAWGAEKVFCVDRFPLLRRSEYNQEVLTYLLSGLEGIRYERAASCFEVHGDVSSGFSPLRIEYVVSDKGTSGLDGAIDMIYSRAVLEHVHDLDASFQDMETALTEGGYAIHKVDLKSHGLHRNNPLDFLAWPESLWNLMYSQKGMPNRWRINKYREIIAKTELKLEKLECSGSTDMATVEEIRPRLAKCFKSLPDEDLRCMEFWMILRK